MSITRYCPVSIVCVWNDRHVLDTCLRGSFGAQVEQAHGSELIAIDNREQQFSTAGAALNHGIRAAKNPVVVLIHQDVVLHSLAELERVAAGLLERSDIGLLGAVGIDDRGRIIGRIRDRVVAIGEPAPEPRPVDTLDEVLLMATRERWLREPVSEDPRLAWHAYGVEYALRTRSSGLRAVAQDVPLTHNSLSTNLARLDVAHRHVGDLYPGLLPIRTTCGTVHSPGTLGRMAELRRKAQGVARWIDESRRARAGLHGSHRSSLVLADIRDIVDEAVSVSGRHFLRVLDLAPGARTEHTAGLTRFSHTVLFGAGDAASAVEEVAGLGEDQLLLLTGLSSEALRTLADFAGKPHVLGFAASTGPWALVGAETGQLAALWPRRRNRPLPVPAGTSR